jgi:hypothetical protein
VLGEGAAETVEAESCPNRFLFVVDGENDAWIYFELIGEQHPFIRITIDVRWLRHGAPLSGR